jgi:hypothetical protein
MNDILHPINRSPYDTGARQEFNEPARVNNNLAMCSKAGPVAKIFLSN